MDDFGSALTGQRVEPAEAMNQWDDWLSRPGNRTALLQMGLNLMQPTAMGQTTGGQIAQAIGSGGEAVARQEASDLKERVADAKMQAADERLRILQQNADSGTLRATSAAAARAARGTQGLTELMKTRFKRQDAAAGEKQLQADAKAIYDQLADAEGDLLNPERKNNPELAKYKGKTLPQIREAMRAERANQPQTAVGDETDDGATPTVQSSAPVPGARQAPDGNYYVPDPKRPGKYLKVVQ